jgi:uncharacterized damage-inducible protein DinB
MIATVAGFLTYFDGVHKRAMRDIASLPAAADGWTPPAGEGEKAWSINQVVGHMAGSRLYFASAFRGEGWISPAASDVSSRERWLSVLEESVQRFRELIGPCPDSWLTRKVETIDSGFGLSGWRVLMMMAEHDVHHRSQLDTYAGLNGWDVPDIYNRSAEAIEDLQDQQLARYRS